VVVPFGSLLCYLSPHGGADRDGRRAASSTRISGGRQMGKGDKKSEKGKRWRKSFGKSRPRHGGKKKGKPASSAS
jgi:ribosomal small subunit protein bTHX